MPFSATDQVRVLIGDYQVSAPSFSDAEVQLFLDTTDGSLYLASALALDSLAAKKGTNLQEIGLGDFRDYSGRNQIKALQDQAATFRQLEYDTPAFAVVEENLSDFNALLIIRNYVLRTNP